MAEPVEGKFRKCTYMRITVLARPLTFLRLSRKQEDLWGKCTGHKIRALVLSRTFIRNIRRSDKYLTS
jgi:hypothetical protein